MAKTLSQPEAFEVCAGRSMTSQRGWPEVVLKQAGSVQLWRAVDASVPTTNRDWPIEISLAPATHALRTVSTGAPA